MPVHTRWISTAAVATFALSVLPTGLLDAAAPTSAVTSTSLAPATPELGYQRVAPWSPGSRSPRSASGWTAVYLGDSMSVATTAEFQAALPGWNVIPRNYGGTAPCDWSDPAALATFFAATRPDVVVFSFIGNSITPCTGHRTGTALLDEYRADLVAICRAAAPARCVAVGQPMLGPTVGRTLPGPDEPTTMYRHHALLGHWGFVDAGAATETPRGAFEQAHRDPDGVHFSQSGAAAQAGAIAAYLRWVTTPSSPGR